ncbi:hypothetical protein [Sinomicrobium soli]|uniref:hypothetical protein n=1 Tax=Sinomicrobium sp. N-1-3-6 TaxID=2219864 RepID=UPI000DCCC7A5|nr:hypothetical protein [Sinomicrobium sp. N-1-3-6]RAV27819.1 hypothetical protein DN748_16965 [Sinomicrobium sp. N-1-3-6]
MFSPEHAADATLLRLLDRVYHEVCYRAYDVPPEHITVLQAKLEKVLAIVDNEFHTCYYSCKREIEDITEREGKESRPLSDMAERLKDLLDTSPLPHLKTRLSRYKIDARNYNLRNAINGTIGLYFKEVQETMQFLDALMDLYGEMDMVAGNLGESPGVMK